MPRDLRGPCARLSRYALSLPEAHEDFPWGERVAKVRGKVFVFNLPKEGASPDGLTLAVKLPVSGTEALGMAFTEPTGYGLGDKGWVTATITPERQPPVDLLLEWIRESYCAVAPKGLAAQVRAGAAEPPAARMPSSRATGSAPRPAKKASSANEASAKTSSPKKTSPKKTSAKKASSPKKTASPKMASPVRKASPGAPRRRT